MSSIDFKMKLINKFKIKLVNKEYNAIISHFKKEDKEEDTIDIVISTQEQECTICYCLLHQKNIVITNCNHVFCADCLKQYMISYSIELIHLKCPMCRQKITEFNFANDIIKTKIGEKRPDFMEHTPAIIRQNYHHIYHSGHVHHIGNINQRNQFNYIDLYINLYYEIVLILKEYYETTLSILSSLLWILQIIYLFILVLMNTILIIVVVVSWLLSDSPRQMVALNYK